MPSGAKKRKAAKKKKVQGESDSGELSSPTSPYPPVEVEKKEDDSSENKSKDTNEEQGHIEIEKESKSKNSNGSGSSSSGTSDDESRVVEKNVVDSLLEEVSQVFDEMKNEKKKDLVVEDVVDVSATAIKDDCPTSSSVVNEVEKLISLDDEKASSVSNDYVLSSPLPENLISEGNGADHTKDETDTVGDSSRQEAPAASTGVAVQRTTTWKSCCGIFELFSGSER